jgi:hypothetical protein
MAKMSVIVPDPGMGSLAGSRTTLLLNGRTGSSRPAHLSLKLSSLRMGAAGQAQREARLLCAALQQVSCVSQEFMNADTCLRANTLCGFGTRLRHPHLGELLFPLRLPGYSIRRTACNQRLEVGDALECLILSIFRKQGANSAQAQQHFM